MSRADRAVYTQCGLRLRSEIELHLPVVATDRWDVDVRWGPDGLDSSEVPPGDAIAEYELDGERWYTATATRTAFHLRFHVCGDFIISSDLSSVEVRRSALGRSELLPILMAGTVSAFLLALRGETVLHASAVAIGSSALAFVGQSGRGKSTVAALMCVEGAKLVTDDVLTVDAGPPVTCIGGATELRLRPAAVSIADGAPDAAMRSTADERLALAVEPAPPRPLRLAAIIVPDPSNTATEVAVRRVPSSTALFAILSFPRVYGWRRADILSRDFAVLTQVVNRVPVYDVTIPWGPPFDPLVANSLAALATDEIAASAPGAEA
jgi:hypothetical protein